MQRWKRGGQGLVLAIILCLVWVGLVLGRGATEPASELIPAQEMVSARDIPANWSRAEAMTRRQSAVETRRDSRKETHDVSAERREIGGTESGVQLAVAALSDELIRVLNELNKLDERADIGDPPQDQNVLTEMSLWDDAATIRATYEIIDLDRLRERVDETRPNTASAKDRADKSVGLRGEISFGTAGSLRIGYGLGHRTTDAGRQLVRIADAEVAYRLGERTLVGADVEWGMTPDGVEHSAGVNVSYMLAPNTSLRARYHLLSFDDEGEGTRERQQAEAGLQLRF